MVGGYCRACQKEHYLSMGKTVDRAYQLLETIVQQGSIDIFRSAESAQSNAMENSFSSALLFGEMRGKMFGVLHYTKENKEGFLYAFSGQYSGYWLVPGWVPPPFSTADFHRINSPSERKIKELSRLIALEGVSERKKVLMQQRKHLSQRLNKRLQRLCHLHNFKGERASLQEIFVDKGIPTGTGECCTPKLLDFAARHKLNPHGICEFFVGKETKSGSCQHAHFYPPCEAKCMPLLGFMLCGL